MTSRIQALAAGEIALAAGGLWLMGGDHGLPVTRQAWLLFVGYALVMTGLALLPPVYVEHQRHTAWLTPSDGAMLIGLFTLGPVTFVAAAMVSEIALAWKLRQPALKTAYNLASMFGGYTAAAVTFSLLDRTDPEQPLAWLGGAAALAACVAWDVASTAAVFSVVEARAFRDVVAELASSAMVSLVLSAVLGLVGLILWNQHPSSALLLVPILGILLLSTRGVSQQRAERRHFERLYGASSRLAALQALPDTLAMVATEGRRLVTGAAGLCCAAGEDGAWIGVIVDDDGPRPANPTVLHALATLATGSPGEIAAGDLPPSVSRALPPFASIVWAEHRVEAGSPVLLAVLRELPPDEQDEHRSDVLGAFVAHAATVIANAGLHEDVQQALERQLVLNRQKSEFVAAVSHELRTPLAGVIGSVQTIHRCGDVMPAEDRREMLELGLSQGARLLALIEDLLLVAAADHDEVRSEEEPVDLAALAELVRRDLADPARDRLQIGVDGRVGPIVSDRDKVRRIMLNLVENASKYAPSGPIELDLRRAGDHIVLTVSDHGPGIPEGDRERVFERFVQLDGSANRRQGGTGLGLHLCRQLAAVLGGELTATAAPSGGARLVLVLPAVAPASDVSAPPPPAQAGTPRAPMKRPDGLARPPLKRPDGRPTSSVEGGPPPRRTPAVPLGGAPS